MKNDKLKFSIFCLIIFCLVSLPVSHITLLGYVPDTSSIYSFYTTDTIDTIQNANIVKNGNSAIVSCDSTNAKYVRKFLHNVLGESVQINNPTKQVLDNICNYIKNDFLYDEIVGQTQIMYCYNPSLANFVMIDKQKVNIQIAKSDNQIVIGYPLILGSF